MSLKQVAYPVCMHAVYDSNLVLMVTMFLDQYHDMSHKRMRFMHSRNSYSQTHGVHACDLALHTLQTLKNMGDSGMTQST